LNNTTNENSEEIAVLSEKETKQYLTPFAFKMDKSLFGLPLASPRKRASALLIDLFLVALLSGISGVILALLIAMTFYYLGNNKNQSPPYPRRKRRALMRFIGAFMIFILLLDTLPTLLEYAGIKDTASQVDVEGNGISFTQTLSLSAFTLSTIQKLNQSDCGDLECWQLELSAISTNIASVVAENEITISTTDLDEIFKDIALETELSASELDPLVLSMHASYNKQLLLMTNELTTSLDGKKDELSIEEKSHTTIDTMKSSIANSDGEALDLSDANIQKNEEVNQPNYSMLEWVKGVINELGLGFGWAMFYFTTFIALGKGQTLGKKLLKIKVIQLDGTPLSLWDSFGRYGGYGAGLATGLLGFIQIYWDPNKQAIHDKISATVVIDLNKARLNE
jgi:uncharacterized RDD family membrane protein YckC